LYLDDQQYALAKLYAEREGRSVSEVVRAALDDFLAGKQRAGKKSRPNDFIVGCMTWHEPMNAALEHNDIYDDVLPWDRKPEGE
jgi:hypothetical protein